MIFIIIPVYNRKEYTKNCLEALRKQTFEGFKIVVVNDGSSDGTSEMLAEEFPEVIELKGNGNLFWTASTNLGIRYALEHGASSVITLNNDTIPFQDFIENMDKWSKAEPNSLLGAMAYDANSKKPEYIGEIINWKTASYNSLPVLDEQNLNGLHKVTHYPGRGLLIPTKAFEMIGLFDEDNFPQYAADFDFTHRALNAGHKIYCNYSAKLYTFPDESGSEKVRNKKSLRNFYYYLFGLKSAGNLKYFTKYAIKNCPSKYLASFIFLGITRRIGGYIRDWI